MRLLAGIGVLVALSAAGVMGAALPATAEDATSHVLQHGTGATVAALVAAAVAIVWTATRLLSLIAKLAFVGAVLWFAGAQLLEAVGGLGYDRFNVSAPERYADLHEVGNSFTTLSSVFVLLSSGLVALSLLRAFGRRR